MTKDNLPAMLPANYESAKKAIAECARVDECKDWADRAAALASYARQAKDPALRSFAIRIRARAISKMGEILESILPVPAKGGYRKNLNSRAGTAREYGLTANQLYEAIRVAKVPSELKERLIEKEPPIPAHKLALLTPPAQMLRGGGMGSTAAFRRAMGTRTTSSLVGIGVFHRWTKDNDARELARSLTVDEAAILITHAVESSEWLDEFVLHLPKPNRK